MFAATVLDWGFLAARLVLAGVFLVAGAVKLADGKGFYQTLVDFGAPRPVIPALRTLLPLLELAVGAALVVASSVWPAAFAALVLLTLFTAAIARTLLLGQSPPCRCFGELSPAPIGVRTLARNSVLLALAAFVAVYGYYNPGQGTPGPLESLRPLDLLIAGGVLGALLFACGVVFVLFQVLRQQGRILLRLEAIEAGLESKAASPSTVPQAAPSGLAVGSAAPPFSAPDLDGVAVSLQDLLAAGKPVLLFFAHPRCGPCEALAPEIAAWRQSHGSLLTLAVISEGGAGENRDKLRLHGSIPVLLQTKTEVADQYRAHGTPSAVIIRADGRIGSPLASGAEAIRRLLAMALESPANLMASTPQPGSMAPAFVLPDLNGGNVSLGDFRGAEILLVFFNPGCGFCRRMREPFLALEANMDFSVRQAVILAQGDAREMAAIEFKSRVLMDSDGAVAKRFGISGTPMALLLDRDGRVASGVAAGADALFKLAENGVGVRINQPAERQDSAASIGGEADFFVNAQ